MTFIEIIKDYIESFLIKDSNEKLQINFFINIFDTFEGLLECINEIQ